MRQYENFLNRIEMRFSLHSLPHIVFVTAKQQKNCSPVNKRAVLLRNTWILNRSIATEAA